MDLLQPALQAGRQAGVDYELRSRLTCTLGEVERHPEEVCKQVLGAGNGDDLVWVWFA